MPLFNLPLRLLAYNGDRKASLLHMLSLFQLYPQSQALRLSVPVAHAISQSELCAILRHRIKQLAAHGVNAAVPQIVNFKICKAIRDFVQKHPSSAAIRIV